MAETHAPTAEATHRWARILLIVLFAGVLIAFFALGGPRYANLETVKAHREALLAYTEAHRPLMLLGAFAVYAASTAFSLPLGLVLTLTCGFLFGRWLATVVVVAGATLGAVLVFVAARYIFADALRRRLGPVGERVNAGFTENAFSYLLFLRLVPVFPFFLVNLAPAFSTVPLRTYAAATAVGIVPGTFVYANLGQALGRIDSTAELASAETLGAFALLGLFALVPVAVKKWRKRP